MQVPEHDFREDPHDEEGERKPQPPPGRERRKPPPQPLCERRDDDREHGEVREIGVDRRRPDSDGEAGLVLHVEEEDWDCRGEHDRSRGHPSVA